MAGVTGALALDLAPAVTAGFGVALAPLGVCSRVYLYRRAAE